MRIVHELIDNEIKYVVYTREIANEQFICQLQKSGIDCISSLDTRSAVYIATGIAGQTGKPVACVVNSTNASRSAFSGMTEAYYRRLPVVLITLGTDLDYKHELKDVVLGHYVLNEDDSIDPILHDELPVHIELITNRNKNLSLACDEVQELLVGILDESYYLYIGSGIKKISMKYDCKVVEGGMPDCYEGALANVLGASLANIRRRYIGLVSEKECMHDINTFGNINVNERLCYIVVSDRVNSTINDYAESLGFKTYCLSVKNINKDAFIQAVSGTEKTVIQIEMR